MEMVAQRWAAGQSQDSRLELVCNTHMQDRLSYNSYPITNLQWPMHEINLSQYTENTFEQLQCYYVCKYTERIELF